jgi:hypothetical protein
VAVPHLELHRLVITGAVIGNKTESRKQKTEKPLKAEEKRQVEKMKKKTN